MSGSFSIVVARQALLGVTLIAIAGASGCRQEVAPLAPYPATNGSASSGGGAGTTEVSRTASANSAAHDSSDQTTGVAIESSSEGKAKAPVSEATTPAAGEQVASESLPGNAEASPARPRPTARRPAIPGQPLEISFDDLVIGMQDDIVFRPWMMSDRAKEIDGQVVRVVGYLHGGVDEFDKLTGEVIILRNKECKFGPGGQADHLLRVFLRKGVKARFTDTAVEITGTLKVNPWQGPDGNTWSLYDIDATAFKDLNRR